MITAMAQGLLSRRWLLAWLIVLGYMAAVAHYSRAQSLSALGTQITGQLTPYAERAVEKPPGVYPRNDYLYDLQGPMVYLLEHHHRPVAMQRVMLLCEARRCYDFIYLYDRCFNWDLRTHLVDECTRAYPDDPLVDWAAGRCLLTGGEYDRAADELLAAERLGFDPQAAGVRPFYFTGRIETALLMAGRVDELLARYRAEIKAYPQEHAPRQFYADLLTRLGRYQESDTVLDAWRAELGPWMEQDVLYMRNAWWSGRLADFEHFAEITAGYGDEVIPEYYEKGLMLTWAGVRVALLRGDYQQAEQLAGGQNETYWRALAEAYSFTGKAEILERIDNETEQAAQAYYGLEANYSRWDARQQASERLGIAESNLLRAHLLRGEWDAVTAILDNRRYKGYATRIEKTYDFARLMTHVAVDYQFEKPWRFGQNRGQLPWLLYSAVVNDAAAAGGVTPDNARQHILAQLAVERDMYHDYSNGSLDW
jgi:tetratricopeptide (TPR) repeat protein